MENTNTQTQRKVTGSSPLSAALVILKADDELKTKTMKFVNFEKKEINWNGVFSQDFGSGHRAALLWAKSIFLDRAPAKVDPFDRVYSMDMHLRIAVLNALYIRWGLGQ